MRLFLPAAAPDGNVAYLFRAQMAEFAFVDVVVSAIEVGGDRVLEERVADRFEAFEIDSIVGVGHGKRLEQESGARPWMAVEIRLDVETEAS